MIWLLSIYIYVGIWILVKTYPNLTEEVRMEENIIIRKALRGGITLKEYRSELRVIRGAKILALIITCVFWPIIIMAIILREVL